MATTTQSTHTAGPVQRIKKPSRLLTLSELAEFKTGPRVNIIIGPEGDRFIGIEGASVKLLAHFSTYAKKKLLDEHAPNLHIPNGSKQAIQWIYRYMQAGHIDVQGQEKFDGLSVDSLVLLYTHSAFLEYELLIDLIFKHLKSKYYHSLPTVGEIRTFQACVPPLYEYVVSILADEMINPWSCSYSAYSELAMVDRAFCDKLEKAVKGLLAYRVEASEKYYATTKNPQVLWSKRYYDNIKNAKVGFTEKDMSKRVVVNFPIAFDSKPRGSYASKKKLVGQKAKARKSTKPRETALNNRDAPSDASIEAGSKAQMSKPINCFNCYYCGETGHIARNCSAKATETLQAAQIIEQLQSSIVTCYNCNKQGHIARNCNGSRDHNIPHRVANKSVVRDTTGRNRKTRRAQNDHFASRIDVTGNGEGIRTCDREVRQGEVTRTGLII